MEGNNYLRIKSKPKYFIFLCLYFFLYPICHVLYGRKNNWLICEKGNGAQDNGYFFFKYLRDNHPEVNVVYLIKKSSPDYKKVATIGKVVEFDSLKHFLMMIGCPVKISSHLFGYSPWIQSTLYYRRHKTRHKHIFLQHGVIKNLHEGLFSNVCKSLDLFVCGAMPEYEFIYDKFNYHNAVPQYTGLPRYDSLDNFVTKNQILYMPTWRANLATVDADSFVESTFFRAWNNLINCLPIEKLCREKRITIKFYLHSSLQKFSHLFKDNDVVKIVNFGDEDVQSLLKECLLLITDYSSVYFDFAYMKKPVIYYQFDEDTFYDEHYHKGYFDYRNDGFGDVCNTIEDVIKSTHQVFNNNFCLVNKYKERINRYFLLSKGDNCSRVYQIINSFYSYVPFLTKFKKILKDFLNKDKGTKVNSFIKANNYMPNKNNTYYYWWNGEKNFGDYLSSVIFDFLTKGVKNRQTKGKSNVLYGLGSIVSFGSTHMKRTIWGSGLLDRNCINRYNHRHIKKIFDIRLLRGPLTESVLKQKGVMVNGVYGDPAIITPLIYSPKIKIKKPYVIISHYLDFQELINSESKDFVVDARTIDYKYIIEAIVSSQLVISSSLHGIIIAESYGVPAIWLKINSQLDPFKYLDYYFSTNRFNIKMATSVEEALSMTPMDLPANLEQLKNNILSTFPYDLF